MIKSLFGEEEKKENQPRVNGKINEAEITDSEMIEKFADAEKDLSQTVQTRNVFEIPESAKFFTKSEESASETLNSDSPIDVDANKKTTPLIEEDLDNLLQLEEETYNAQNYSPEIVLPAENTEDAPKAEIDNTLNDSFDTSPSEKKEMFGEPKFDFQPETQAETIRKSGLAYSAGIILFASIVFTMILGWFADLLLGSSPWGIVGGIILGAIIGFIQFFRITSSIFKK